MAARVAQVQPAAEGPSAGEAPARNKEGDAATEPQHGATPGTSGSGPEAASTYRPPAERGAVVLLPSTVSLRELQVVVDGCYKIKTPPTIEAIAWRDKCTYEGCTRCRRKVHPTMGGSMMCMSHGVQTESRYYFSMRMMLEDGPGVEDEVWVIVFDNMAALVDYHAANLVDLEPDDLRDTVLSLVGTVVDVELRKNSWGGSPSYSVRSLKKISD